MRIKTNYDCTFEERDMVHLAKGRQLAATLSDGSVAFRFNLDPELLQHGPKRLVRGVVVDETQNGNGHQPRQLTDGKKRSKTYTHRGPCAYCKDGKIFQALENHIRNVHPGKSIHPNGKHRCAKCPQRFPTANGLMRHDMFTHGKNAANIRKRIGRRLPATVPE
jgi:hypothetical protein